MSKPEIFTTPVDLGDLELLSESKMGEEKKLKIKGPFIVPAIKNGNARIYELHSTNNSVREYINEFLPNRGYGELNHPNSAIINPDRIACMTEKLTYDESAKIWMGVAKITTSTPLGKIARDILVEEKGVLGVSCRVLGTKPDMEGNTFIRKIVTPADIVVDPSQSQAIVEMFMECKEYYMGLDDSFVRPFETFSAQVHSKPVESAIAMDNLLKAIKFSLGA